MTSATILDPCLRNYSRACIVPGLGSLHCSQPRSGGTDVSETIAHFALPLPQRFLNTKGTSDNFRKRIGNHATLKSQTHHMRQSWFRLHRCHLDRRNVSLEDTFSIILADWSSLESIVLCESHDHSSGSMRSSDIERNERTSPYSNHDLVTLHHELHPVTVSLC